VTQYHIDQTAQDVLFRSAHTAHAFSDVPVTDAEIEAVLDLVQWAPTSMNSGPMRVVLVRSPEARTTLISHLFEPNRAKSAAAPLHVILAADTDFHLTLPRLVPAATNPQDRFPDPVARAAFARSQAWMQVAYFLIGVRAIGLAAGPMTGFDAAAVDRDLLAGTTLNSLAVVNLGHPAEGAFRPRAPRLDASEVLRSI
jgi:3-hydroxypropanoate dehydrogenase